MIVFCIPIVLFAGFLGVTWVGTRLLKARYPGWPSLSFIYIIIFLTMLLIVDSGIDWNSRTEKWQENEELIISLLAFISLCVFGLIAAVLALLKERPISYPLTSACIFAVSVTLYLLYRM